MSHATGLGVRSIYARRANLEARGYHLPTTSGHVDNATCGFAYAPRHNAFLEDGVAVIFSDRHWWPGDGMTPAEAALLAVLHQLDPDLVIANGDVLDGARQSKHAPLGWERKPAVADELATVQVGMRRIAEHCRRARKMRTVGNHDRRFDYHLAKAGPDYRGIVGTRLSDHLPEWEESWSVHINEGIGGGHMVVKHKIGNGATAGRTNAIKAGVHIATAHTHRLSVDAIETYAGRHYGIQCGTLADPRGPQFEYGEDTPDAGRAGFVVLTWRSGLLQPPELAEVDDAGVCWFRGEPVTIKPRVRVAARSA
jgi:hypothetical protein